MKCKDIQHYLREIYSTKNRPKSERYFELIQEHLSECRECREYAAGLEQLKMIKVIDIPKVSEETIRLEQVKVFDRIENKPSHFALKPIIASVLSIAFVMVILLNMPFSDKGNSSEKNSYIDDSFSYLTNLSYLSSYETHSDLLLSENDINDLLKSDNSFTTEEISKEIEFIEYLLAEEDV